MTDTHPKIRLKNLHKRFGDKIVLNGLNLDVGKGESVVIMGGSGSGKSVSLKCLLGLLTPDEGQVEIDGEPLKIPAILPKLESTPGRTDWPGREIGSHNEEVLKDILELDDAEIERLRGEGVVA